LLCQKSYPNRKLCEMYLNKSAQYLQKKSSEVHPILKARFAAWNFILNDDSSYLQKAEKTLIKFNEKTDFFVFYARLLWTFLPVKSIDCLNTLNLTEIPAIESYFEKGRTNVLMLTKAINSYLNNDLTEAKSMFDKFDQLYLGYDIVNEKFYANWIEKLSNLDLVS